jgi:hypothetical protein
MRMTPTFKEDQMAGLRPDDGAVPSNGIYARRIRVMCENKLASVSGAVISAEQKSGERVRINMEFESHRRSALDIYDDAITIVLRRLDRFSAYRLGQVKKMTAIRPTEPGQTVAHLRRVHPAP